jgi:hypothetical protein
MKHTLLELTTHRQGNPARAARDQHLLLAVQAQRRLDVPNATDPARRSPADRFGR